MNDSRHLRVGILAFFIAFLSLVLILRLGYLMEIQKPYFDSKLHDYQAGTLLEDK